MNAPIPALTREEFDRIDDAVLAVLQRPDMFTGAEVDFAYRKSELIEDLGIYAVATADDWAVIERIESVTREDFG